MKRLIYLLIAAASCITSVQAQDNVRQLTLDDCRSLALSNNSAIKMARGEAQAATEVRRGAFTKYFPEISASGMAFAANKYIVDYDILHMFTLQMVRRGISAGITAVQPLFAGGRIVNGNKLAAVGEEAGKLKYENAVDDVTLKVEEYYWQVVTLKAKKNTLTSVISLVDSLSRTVDMAVKAGVVTNNDLLKVNLRRNELYADMVDLDNGIALATNLMAQYVGLDGQPIDVVAEQIPADVAPIAADLYADPSAALASTANYRLLEQSVRAADLRKKIALGENLPTVGVGAGYFYDDVINQPNNFGAVFVSVSIPISGWWGGSHAMKKASIEADNARAQMDDLSQMLRLNMQNTWDNLTAAHRKMSIARESIDQADENLRISENFYSAGVSTITDLLEAQALYRNSCDSYTEAYGKYRLSLARYLNATGRLGTDSSSDTTAGSATAPAAVTPSASAPAASAAATPSASAE